MAGTMCGAQAGLADTEVGDRFARLEALHGGRLGVMALDTGSARRLAHRAGERFPLCSTFKWLAAAAVLRRVDQHTERLDRRIAYGKARLQHYSPVTAAHAGTDGLTVGALCAAAMEWSDNTAANLLLESLGGPPGVTGFARAIGDGITRLDRNEPTLNTALPDDPRDTTTPAAMVDDLQRVLLGAVLRPSSRQQLLEWMVADQVGTARLRAGLPPGWRIGDKTGTGDHGTANDVGILWPPGRPPILIASYLTGAGGATDTLEPVHAEVARITAAAFGTPGTGSGSR